MMMDPANRGPLDNPINEIQASKILGLLRDQTRRAHYIGDGFLVNHLCALALERIIRLQQDEQLVLPLKETFWAMSLAMYWLLDEDLLGKVRTALEFPESSEVDDQHLGAILRQVLYLIQNPLAPAEDSYKKLIESELEWLSAEYLCEGLALISFCIELVWQRDPGSHGWSKLIKQWSAVCLKEFRKPLEDLRPRLLLQTGLVFPESTPNEPKLSDSFLKPIHASLYKGWQQYLECQWSEMDETISDIVPRIQYDSPDFLPLCGLQRLNYSSKVQEDPSSVIGTRWQLKVSSGGTSAFRESRRTRFGQLLARVWRKGPKEARVSELVHGFRLGILDQIASLREWDAWAWNIATGQLAEASLAVAIKLPNQYLFAVNGLILAMRSSTLNIYDPIFKSRLSILDFAPVEERTRFVESVLQSRPVESFKTLRLLSSLSDSIPESLLPQVANWCVDYVNYSGNRLGSTVHPLSFWAKIIPYVQNPHVICRRLYPAVLKLANYPAVWQTDDEGMLTEFLTSAPMDLAIEVGEKMMRLDEQDERASSARWALMFNAVMRRSESTFTREFKHRLIATARTEDEKFLLPLLENPELTPDELDDSALHQWCKEQVRRQLEIVRNRTTGDSVRHGGDVSEFTVTRVKWTREDTQMLGQIIEAIDSALQIQCFELERFLYYCAGMVSVGPRDFVDIARPAILRWIDTPPECRDSFAPLNAKDRDAQDRVLSALAYVAAEMVLQENGKDHVDLAQWVIRNGFSCSPVAIANMMFLGAVLGARLTGITGISVMSTFQSLLVRAWQLPGVPAEENKVLSQVIRQIAVMADPKDPYNIYRAENVESSQLFFDSLSRIIPSFEKYPNPDVRAAAAQVLRCWKAQGSMPTELEKTLFQFQQDPRARVRFETRNAGG
ncbi:MAG: hypothetical protein M1511_09915 [Deltaproteobacteria bacterium]|nr:hypothetical protein [Deltaproteobacteria bacterium]